MNVLWIILGMYDCIMDVLMYYECIAVLRMYGCIMNAWLHYECMTVLWMYYECIDIL